MARAHLHPALSVLPADSVPSILAIGEARCKDLTMPLDRPRFRRDLEAVPFEADGQVFVEVRDPGTGDAFQFYEFEYRVALAFDGLPFERVIPWLKLATGMQFQLDQLRDFAHRLDELGFLEPGATNEQTEDATETPDSGYGPTDEAWSDVKTQELAAVATEVVRDAPESLSQALEQAVDAVPQPLDEPTTEPSSYPHVDESTPPVEPQEGTGNDDHAETPAPEDMLAEQTGAGHTVESSEPHVPEPESGAKPEPSPEPALAVEQGEPAAPARPIEEAEDEIAELVATVESETEQGQAQAEAEEAAEELVSALATEANVTMPMVAYKEEESAAPGNEPAHEPLDETAIETTKTGAGESEPELGASPYGSAAESEEPAETEEAGAAGEAQYEPAAEVEEATAVGEAVYEPAAEVDEAAEAEEPAETEEAAAAGEAVYEPAAETEEAAVVDDPAPVMGVTETAEGAKAGATHPEPGVADASMAVVEPSVPLEQPPEKSGGEGDVVPEPEALPQSWPQPTSVTDVVAGGASVCAAPSEEPVAASPEASEEPTAEPEAETLARQTEASRLEARAELDESVAASEGFEPEPPLAAGAEALPSVEEPVSDEEATPVAEARWAGQAQLAPDVAAGMPTEAPSGEQPAAELDASPVDEAVVAERAKRPSREEPATAVDASLVAETMAEGTSDSSESEEPTTEVEAPLAAVAELAASLPAASDEAAEAEESPSAKAAMSPAQAQATEEAGVHAFGPLPSAGSDAASGMARYLDSSAFPVLPTPPPQTVSPGPAPSKGPPVRANPQAFVTPRPATLGPLVAVQQAAVRRQQRRSLLLFGSLGVIAAVAVLAVLVPFLLSVRESPQVEVRTLVVAPGTIFRYFPGAGIVTALPGEVLKFPAGGRVTRIVKPGGMVTVGDVLAAVDPSRPLLAQLAQHRERLAFYQQLVDAMHQVGNKDEEERHAANVEARKAKIAKTLRALSRVAVVARAAGEVDEVFAREGDTVEAGSLALRMRSGGHRAVFEMPRSQASEARRLGLCQVGVESLVLDCTQIQERGDDTHVTVDISGLPQVLMGRPARLARARYDAAVALPRAAILGTGRRPHVLLVSPLGRIETRPVTLVEQNVAEAIVIQGLDPGDNVVIDPTSELRPGMHASVKS